MRCLVCDHDEWQNVDEFRAKKEGMAVCKHCGFISYPAKWATEADIKAYYLKDYRPGPKVSNMWSGQRKIHYHNAFLQLVFKKWADEKNIAPVVGEVGAAYGQFLNYIREVLPQHIEGCVPTIVGTEWTETFRRNAFHEFGIELDEDFDDTLEYDMIASYKVAEHQMDADQLLIKYKKCLKPGGFMYISVPTWFNKLTNFGAGGFDIEYYFHPNHINVWTKKLFEVVLKKAGLKIVQYNGTFYDDTYLCVRDDSLMAGPFEYEDPENILRLLKLVHDAGRAYMEGRHQDAVNAWPNFPEAHVNLYEHSRQKLHQLGFDGLMKESVGKAFEVCGQDCAEVTGMAADLCMRYGKYEEANKYFEKMLTLRPGYGPALRGMAQSVRQMGHIAWKDRKDMRAYDCWAKARDITRYLQQVSKQDEAECINWIYDDNSRLPMPSELALPVKPALGLVKPQTS